MARSIKGITIEIEGKTSKLEEALKGVNKSVSSMNSELKDLDRALKLDPKNTELLAQKQEVLQKNIAASTEKLNTLKEAQKQMGDYNKLTDEQKEKYRALSVQIAQSEGAIKNMNTELAKGGKGGNYNEVKKGLDDVGKKALSVGDIIKANLLSDAIKGGMKALANGMKSVGSAMGSALSSGATYADDILTLSTQTGIAADELQKYKAMAELTDVPVETITKSMAKMTKSLESNEDQYKSLGVSIRNADGSLRNNQDIFNETIGALGKMENATERDALSMKLFGKSAQELNPLIKLGADGMAEMTQKVEQMGAVLSKDGLEALGKLDDEFQIFKTTASATGNILASAFAPAITDVMGQVNQLGGAFNNLLASVISGDDEAIDAAMKNFGEIITGLADALAEKSSEIMELGFEILNILIDGIAKHLPKLAQVAVRMISQLLNGITTSLGKIMPVIVQVIMEIVRCLIDNLPTILQAGITIIIELIKGIAQALPTLIPAIVEAIYTIVETLIENIDLIIDAGIQILLGLIQGIIQSIPVLIEHLPKIIIAIVKAIIENLPLILKAGWQILVAIKDGIVNNVSTLWNYVKGIPGQIKTKIVEKLQDLKDAGKELIQGLYDGLMEKWRNIKEKIANIGNGIKDKFKDVFKIKSPSRVFRDEIGKQLAAGLGIGFEEEMKHVSEKMLNSSKDLTYGIMNSMNPMINPNALNLSNQNLADSLQGISGGGEFNATIINNSKYTTPSDNVRLLRQQYELYNLKYGRSRG